MTERLNYNFTDGTQLEVGTMYCIGRNYAEHAKELGNSLPETPLVFLKPPSAYASDGSSISIPSISQHCDYEVELVVVLGKSVPHQASEVVAKSCIAGYAVGIDLTLRDVQKKAKAKGEPWTIAKAFRKSAPISQVLSAREVALAMGDAIPNFDLSLKVNGTLKQFANTYDMERTVTQLITFLSNIFDLRAGDCIFTGTPSGVGQIVAGDSVHAELSGVVSLQVKIQ